MANDSMAIRCTFDGSRRYTEFHLNGSLALQKRYYKSIGTAAFASEESKP